MTPEPGTTTTLRQLDMSDHDDQPQSDTSSRSLTSYGVRLWRLAYEHPWRTLATSIVVWFVLEIVATAIAEIRRSLGL